MDLLDGIARALLQSIATIVPARDMRRSIAFYEQLGFVARAYDEGLEYIFLSRDGQSLHLSPMAEEAVDLNPLGIYLYVDDVDVLYEEITAAGIISLHPPQDKPWRMREFAVSDPDGALLRFGQHCHGR